jgi:hypothetical protein
MSDRASRRRQLSWVMNPPVVVEVRGDDRKEKPRSTDAHRVERRLYRSAERFAEATDVAIRNYNRARRKSARRENDGPVIDLIPNMTRGLIAGSRRLTLVPADLLRVGSTDSMRRLTRRSLRAAGRMLDGS